MAVLDCWWGRRGSKLDHKWFNWSAQNDFQNMSKTMWTFLSIPEPITFPIWIFNSFLMSLFARSLKMFSNWRVGRAGDVLTITRNVNISVFGIKTSKLKMFHSSWRSLLNPKRKKKKEKNCLMVENGKQETTRSKKRL